MDEVLAILIALIALLVGILGIGWAYGDFRPRVQAPQQPEHTQKPTSPA
jgi:hypothetical protein